MKKSLPFLVVIVLFLYGKAYSFDAKGLQPVDPYGIFSTFSAESLGKGKAAFSAGAEMSVDPDFYRFVFKSAYGITDKLELDLTVPYVLSNNSSDGFEDTALGLKHRFFDEGKYGPSLAYILQVSLPSGADQLSSDGSYGAGVVVSKRVGPVNGHLNFFYEKPGDDELEEEVIFTAGFDFAAASNFKLLGELFCRKSYYSNRIDTVEGRFGYRLKTTDSIYTTFGAGFDFKNRNPETRVLFTVTFLTGQEKKKIHKIYEEEQ